MSLTRRSLQVFALLCTLIIGTASMAVIVTQTTWFKEWLRGFIVRQADDYVNGRLTIGRLDGNLFFGVEMEDVDVTVNGKPVVALKDVGLDYNLLTFIRGHVVLDHIRLNKPTLHLEKTATGWNLVQLIKAQTPNPNQAEEPPADRDRRDRRQRRHVVPGRAAGGDVGRRGSEGHRQDRRVGGRDERRE